MQNKKLAIITVCFNDRDALVRTIESIKMQNIAVEHIVIDGGSSDGTLNVLVDNSILNPNFSFVSESDKGVYDALNKGVMKATSEYLLILNAGDTLCTSDTLSEIDKNYLFDQDYLVGRVEYVNRKGQVKSDSIEFPSLKNLECSHQAFLYKKNLHEIFGLYSIDYKSASDYDFFCKVFHGVGLLQNSKAPIFIATREKFGGDLSDSIMHTLEMIRLDFKHSFIMITIPRRAKELLAKLVKKLINFNK